MKIQYMSDLHLEMAENCRHFKYAEIPVTGDVLVLAGDTFYLNDALPLTKFWKWASENYRQVILVPGNHEFYHQGDIMENGPQWKKMILPNVGIYQNQVHRVDNTDFILSTLWSHINPQYEYQIWRGLADFHQSLYGGEPLTIKQYNQLHADCFNFIKEAVAKSTAEHIVVVSHHLPTTLVVAPWHYNSPLNSAFATELGDYIADSNIDVWIYGHSHANLDAKIGNTVIVSNQLGYAFEFNSRQNGFDFGKCITI